MLITAIGLIGGCAGDRELPGGSGLIEATEVIVSAETSGRVTALRFDEGVTVNPGDTLLLIDPSRLDLELAAARAGRGVAEAHLSTTGQELRRAKETEQYARTEFDRIERLLGSGTATRKQHDDAKHQYSTATIAVATAEAAQATVRAELEKIDADIARLQRQRQDTSPTAPIAGTVTEKYVEAGELLAAGRPIAKIARLDSVWVKVYLPMADFAEIKLGDSAAVDTEAGATFDGVVTWTSDEAEFTPKNVQTKKARADLVYAVKVSVANPDKTLKIGQPVFVTIGR